MRKFIATILFGATVATLGYMAAPEDVTVKRTLCTSSTDCFDCQEVFTAYECDKLPD